MKSIKIKFRKNGKSFGLNESNRNISDLTKYTNPNVVTTVNKNFHKIPEISSITQFNGFFNKKFDLTIYKKDREDSRNRSRSPERIYKPHEIRGNGIPDGILQKIKLYKDMFNEESFQKFYKLRPKKKEANFDEISDYIVSYGKTHSEIESIFMAYYFVCNEIRYDYSSKFNKLDKKYSQRIGYIFQKGKSTNIGFTNIFEYLLKKLQVKYKHIEGYCKLFPKEKNNLFSPLATATTNFTKTTNNFKILSSSFKIDKDDNFYNPSQMVNHCWNAIFLKGEWYFIDTCLGSGYIKNKIEDSQNEQKTDNEDKPNLDFNPFYFMTPPEFLINTHRPLDDEWQLIPKTLTMKQFLSKKLLNFSQFYKYLFSNDLELISHNFPYISLKEKESLVIKISKPDSLIEADLIKVGTNEKVGEVKAIFDEETKIFSLEPTFPGNGEYIIKISSRLLISTDLLYFPLIEYQIKVGNEPKFTHFDKYKILKTAISKRIKLESNNSLLPKLKNKNYIIQPKIITDYTKVFPSRGVKKICYDNENFCLIEPRTLFLKKGTTVTFKIKIKGASNVVVLDGNNITPLKKTDEYIYEGQKEIKTDNVSICCLRGKNVFTEVQKFKPLNERFNSMTKSILTKIRNRTKELHSNSINSKAINYN